LLSRIIFSLTRFFRDSPKPPTPAGDPSDPTIVGAANAGLVGNGASMLHLSSAAVGFTAFGVLVALL